MTALIDIVAQGSRVDLHRPWPRIVVDAAVWRLAGRQLADGLWTLVGLWGRIVPVVTAGAGAAGPHPSSLGRTAR